jgi:hypothetical protein
MNITDDIILAQTNGRIDYDNGVAGSLRFFSTSDSAERMRIQSDGNLGIGTSSPDTKLHIVNDSATTNAGVKVLTLTQSTSGTPASGLGPGITFVSERPSSNILLERAAIYGIAGADPDDDGDLAFYTRTDTGAIGVSEKVRITSGGNVGIGITNPAYKLHVDGDIGVNANDAFKARYTTNDNYHGSFRWAGLQLGNNGGNRIIAGRTATGGYLQFWVNNTNDASDYNVTPDGTNILTLAANGTSTFTGGVTAPSFTGSLQGNITGTAASETLQTVTTRGNTSNTQIVLSSLEPQAYTNTGTDTYTKSVLYHSYTYGYMLELAKVANLNSADPIDFHITARGGGYSPLFITGSTGYVGIGTNNPIYQLDVKAPSTLGFSLKTVNSTVGGPMIDLLDTGRSQETVISSTDGTSVGTYIASYSNHPLMFGTYAGSAPTEKMRITTGGNVGIGVTDPEKRLEVKSDTTYDGILIDTLSAPEIVLRDRGNSDTLIGTGRHGLDDFHIDTYAGNAFFIKGSSRNVGIGTISPQARLHVSGSILAGDITGAQTSNSITIYHGGGNSADGTIRSYFELTNPSAPYVNVPDAWNWKIATVARPGTSGNYNSQLEILRSTRSGVTDDPTMVFSRDGNVGIGVTTPSSKLEINGDLRVATSATIGVTSVVDSTTNHENYLRVQGKNNYSDGTTWYGNYGQIILHSDSNMTASARRFLITSALGNNKFAIVRSVDANTDPVVNSTGGGSTPDSGTADFVIDNTGNTGIGNANPTAKLHVAGTIINSTSVGATGDSGIEIGTGNRLGFDESGVRSWTVKATSGNLNFSSGDGNGWYNFTGKGVIATSFTGSLQGNVTGTAASETLATVTGRGASTSTASTFSGTLTVAGGGNTLTLVKGTGAPAIAFAGTSDQATGLIEGVSGGGIKMYAATGSLSSPTYTDTFNIKNGGDAYFNYNVGIGTTSPAAKLQIGNGTSNSPSSVAILSADGGNAVLNALSLVNSRAAANGNGTSINFHNANNYGSTGRITSIQDSGTNASLRFSVYNSTDDALVERITLLSTGNVGIGTDNPESKLDVGKNEAVNNQIQISTGVWNEPTLFFSSYSNYNYTLGNFGTSGSKKFQLRSNNGSVILSTGGNDSGNVGIGTTTPLGKFDVFRAAGASGTSAIVISNGEVNGRNWALSTEVVTGGDFAILCSSATGGTPTPSAANTKLYITSGGNVGIGTTSPATKLNVLVGAGGANGTAGLRIGGTANYASLELGIEGDYNGQIRTYGNDLHLYAGHWRTVGLTATEDHAIRFFTSKTSSTNWSTAKMILTADGSVGIGTASPGYKLEVNGYIRANDRFYATNGTNTMEIGSTYIQSYLNSGTAAAPIIFYIGASEKVRIDAGGNVGMGTTSPTFSALTGNTAKGLHIQNVGNDTQASLRLTGHNNTGSPGQATFTELLHAGGDLRFDINHNGTTVLTINPSSNVGIGTTSPGTKLEVNSGGTVQSARFTSTGTASEIYLGTNGVQSQYTNIVWYTNNGNAQIWKSGTGYTAAGGAGALNIYNSNGKIAFHPAGNYNAMTIDTTTNVGIGSTAPVAKLNVVGGADVLIVEGSGSTANTTIMAVDGNNGRLFEVSDDLSDSLFSVNTIAGLPVMEAFADNTVILGAYNQCDLVISGSKVGIGTCSPTVKLHVADSDGGRLILQGVGGSGINWQLNSYTDGKLYIGNYGVADYVAVTPTGNVGIGSVSPAYKLDVTGTIRATGDVIAYSDARVKENVLTLENSLEKVQNLRGVSYNKIGEPEKKIGVIAQEVLEVIPEVVSQDSEGTYSVAYGNITAVLIEAIKEQQTQIDELKEEIKKLKG